MIISIEIVIMDNNYVYQINNNNYPRPEAGIALNMRSRIFMFPDVRTYVRYDHESHASNIEKATSWLIGLFLYSLKGGLNITEDPQKTAPKYSITFEG